MSGTVLSINPLSASRDNLHASRRATMKQKPSRETMFRVWRRMEKVNGTDRLIREFKPAEK
jgi:hypothetical protein